VPSGRTSTGTVTRLSSSAVPSRLSQGSWSKSGYAAIVGLQPFVTAP
jgi:hypothetical protein